MTQSTLTNLKKQVAPYEKSNARASIKQLINTLGPLFILWLAAYLSLSISYWITLPITIIASGFVIRTFIIFHDCCHQSFFKSRRANEIIGTITGILTLFPYQQWKNSHSIHHATSSNLEKRGIGDMWLLTVDEYAASSIWVSNCVSVISESIYYVRTWSHLFVPIYEPLEYERCKMQGKNQYLYDECLYPYFIWVTDLDNWMAVVCSDPSSNHVRSGLDGNLAVLCATSV